MDEYLEQYPELIAIARRMRDGHRGLEEILVVLRRQCPSIIQSIKVVRAVMGMPLGEAKRMVESSDAWSDLADQHSDLHDAVESLYMEETTPQEDGTFRVEIDLRPTTNDGSDSR